MLPLIPLGNNLKSWYDDEVHEARRIRCRLERQYSKSKLEIHRQLLKEQSINVVRLIDLKKAQFYNQKLAEADTKDTFRLLNTLMCTDKPKPLPSSLKSDGELARSFVNYFQHKVSKIYSSITPSFQTSDIGSVSLVSSELVSYQLQSTEAMTKLIKQCASNMSKSCPLDPIPTLLLKDDIILRQKFCLQ